MAVTKAFEELLADVRNGDEAALTQLVELYEPDVRLVARLRLGATLRPHLDSVDIVQSVHRSIMIGLRGGRFDIATPEKLVALALTMVRRKVINHWRHLQRQQRLSGGGTDDRSTTDVLAAIHAKPDDAHDAVATREAIERLMAELDAQERELVAMRLEGFSTAEVGRKLGLDPDVLRVRLSRLRRRITELGLLSDWL